MTSPHAGGPLAGRYAVERTLGQGAFGRTVLAHDVETGTRVAVKLLEPRRVQDVKAFELFEREASVLAALRHHGIPAVHGSGRCAFEGAEAAFLVMDYVEGESLEARIARGHHADAGEVLHLLVELLGILEYLHGRVPPILHRDLKPANIIVRPDGSVALVDFGAVRRVFLSEDESGSTVVGTYGYMPFEQHVGQATPASDLYALGATLLHLLTGRPPREFAAEDGRIVVPDDLPAEPRLRAVVARLLRPSPLERFRTAREVRAALFADAAPASVALVPGSAPGVPALTDLAPAPRPLTGPAADLYRRLAWPWWRIADGSAKPTRGTMWVADIGNLVIFAIFSVLTAGILPGTFIALAGARRRRVRRFLTEGEPAVGTITGIELADLAFGEKMARVSYEFEASGRLWRDADKVLPATADRWRAGDRIALLVLPHEDHDSMIATP